MLFTNREYIKCPECPKCKPKEGLRDGAKWGICGEGGNIVYLEPWKEKRISGKGWIHHPISSCGIYEKNKVKESFFQSSAVEKSNSMLQRILNPQQKKRDVLICKIDDFDYTVTNYRSQFIGKSKNGQEIYKGIFSKETSWGDIEENEWYRVAKELITIAGEMEILEGIKKHCRNFAWMKSEEDAERYAIECMLCRAYEHWPETKELSSKRTNKWVFYFEDIKGRVR